MTSLSTHNTAASQLRSDKNSNPDDPARWLLCRVASHHCAIPMQHVIESMRPLAIEKVSSVPPLILGLAVIRGAPTPVIDTALLFGEREARCERFVLVRTGERTIALALGGITGVRLIDNGELDALPPLMSEAHAFAALKAFDGELVFFLQSARLVPDDVLRRCIVETAAP